MQINGSSNIQNTVRIARGGAQETVEMEGTSLPNLSRCEKVGPSRELTSSPFTVSLLLKDATPAPGQLKDLENFAKKNGLSVDSVDPETRTVKLKGEAGGYEQAFGVELNHYTDPQAADGKPFRGYEGNLSMPKSLAGSVESVLGLSDRPVARPRTSAFQPTDRAVPSKGYNPADVAKAYNFPKNTTGKGQNLAIIELGGGFKQGDLEEYFHRLNMSVPKIKVVEVDGGKNAPENNPGGADGEVALDVEVAGVVAPDSNITVYFAPNTDAGFLDAVNQAAHDQAGNPGAISISWGGPESEWTDSAMKSFDGVLKDAAALGVNVYTASGDDGSSDGVHDKKPHVDFPSASPWNISTGGTRLNTDSNGQRSSETAWGGSFFGGASGGGFSNSFPLPDFQNGVVKNNPNGGRGVPDISGNGDPATGYNVLVDGQDGSIGGTSAVAPLMAALNARLGEAVGKPHGYLNPFFYKHPEVFTDITSGTNGAFKAGPGWDAVTGMGVPDGEKLLAALKA